MQMGEGGRRSDEGPLAPRVALHYKALMNDKSKPSRPKARVAKGFRDIDAAEIRGTRAMLATIQRVYESYGFEPVEQPFIEYTDALGKFLPDQDRPNQFATWPGTNVFVVTWKKK